MKRVIRTGSPLKIEDIIEGWGKAVIVKEQPEHLRELLESDRELSLNLVKRKQSSYLKHWSPNVLVSRRYCKE